MLTFPQLVSLHRSLHSRLVLTVYVDGTATDPAVQRSWRIQLDNSIRDLREWVSDSAGEERMAFERCLRTLDSLLSAMKPALESPGWVAFIADDGTIETHELPVPVPTLAVWSTGPAIAPCVRALKEAQPVIAIIADASMSNVFRYQDGQVDHVATIRAHHLVEPASHMGTPPKSGFHPGTRGTAGKDAAQRSLLQGRDRMLDETAERVRLLSGDERCFVVIGGIERVAKRIATRLDPAMEGRVTITKSLDVHSTSARIAEVVRAEARDLRASTDNRRLTEIAESAGAGGLGVLGPTETRAQLEKATVRDLYLTHDYLENHAAEAEWAVRQALDQRASVEEVSSSAAERLKRVGGMAAGLRFRSEEPAAVE